jgi:hypothetical protein
LNILTKDREAEISALVADGRITPAVSDKLKAKFAKRESIQNFINDEGEPIDGFDEVIAALKENEKVLNYGGQTTPLPKPGEQQEENPLLANAKARAGK